MERLFAARRNVCAISTFTSSDFTRFTVIHPLMLKTSWVQLVGLARALKCNWDLEQHWPLTRGRVARHIGAGGGDGKKNQKNF